MSNQLCGTRKAAIIGAGFVGASIAYVLAMRESVSEIVLIDMDRVKAEGEAMDIRHGIRGMGTVNLYAGDYKDIADCEVIIITAGRNRRVGENRLDLAKDNVKILHSVVESMKPYYNGCVVIMVANPVDIMTLKAQEWLDKKDGTIFGTGCVLDTSRFIRLISDHVGLSANFVYADIVGEHGDSQVPIWSRVRVAGMAIDEYCEKYNIEWNEDVKNRIAEETKKMGGVIIKNKGKTHYGIATSVCYLVESIINKKSIVAPVSVYFNGERGVEGISISVPCIVGAEGVRAKIDDVWTEEEDRRFAESAARLKETLAIVEGK